MFGITSLGIYMLIFVLFHSGVPVSAMYESQAGIFDWHQPWIGHPRKVFKIDDDHIAVYSDANVFASINKNTGSVAWRQKLDNQLTSFKISDKGILTLSTEPERAQFWNKTNGQLIWDILSPIDKQIGIDEPILWDDGELAIFLENTELLKISKEGRITNKWTKPESEGNGIKTLEKDGLVYVVIEPKEDVSSPYFLINTLDKDTLAVVKTLQIHCNPGFSYIDYIGNYIFWIEEDQLKWTSIDKQSIQSVDIKDLGESTPIADEFIPSQISLFGDSNTLIITVEYEEEEQEEYEVSQIASSLFKIEGDGKHLLFKKYFDAQPSFGGLDFIEQSAIRVYRSAISEFTIYISPQEREIKVKHDFEQSGDINYVKVVQLDPIQIMVVTEGSSVFFYNETELLWSREESLSNIVASEFLELPEKKMWTQTTGVLDETLDKSPFYRYIHRLKAHIHELKRLPEWLANIYNTKPSTADREISLIEAQSCWVNSTDHELLYRDNFGLRKLLVSVTKSGKIIAQDTSRKGKIVWSRYVPSYSFNEIYVVRAATANTPPVIVAIGSSYNSLQGDVTGFFRLDGLTGMDYISSTFDSADYFEPIVTTSINLDKIMRLPIEDPEEKTHFLAAYEADSGRVYIYPDTVVSREKFAEEFLSKFYIYEETDKGLQGHKVIEGYRGSLKVMPVWNFTLPEGEKILTSSKSQSYEKIASLGRALGNRNVLYKYLNPHMFALVTKKDSLLKVRIIDSVKGSILYETIHENIDVETNKFNIIQSENWFVYHFWSNDSKAKGYQAAVLELFEGKYENERIESTNFSSYNNYLPHVQSSVFSFPYAVNTMGLTTTKNGISTKAILFGLPSNQIVSINKRMLDPRRPKDKPTTEEIEEMLIPYAPIQDEKRLFLTHNLEVIGLKSIISSPSLLESTSLVFSYGLDTFFTQVSPSRQFDVLSEDFSKIQLLITIAGLSISIIVLGPMVRKKRVNALWK